MAAENFKPDLIAAAVERQIEQESVLVLDSGYQYGGDIKRFGTLTVKGVVRPKITDYDGKPSSPEKPETTAVTLTLDQSKKVFFMLDRVDQSKGVDGYIEALKQDATAGFAEERDKYIGEMFKKAKSRINGSVWQEPKAAKKAVDAAIKQLMGNGVKFGKDQTYLELTPWAYLLFKDYLTDTSTNNVDLLKRGIVGMYNGAYVRYSNLMSHDGEHEVMCLRTNKAIGFKGGITEMKETELTPLGITGTGVLGVDVYGGKIVRQDEIVAIYGKEGV